MKKVALALALMAIGLFPLAATMSQAADSGTHESHHAAVTRSDDTGNRFCMSGSPVMDGGMMSGMMGGGMMNGMMTGARHQAKTVKNAPACGMSESDCSANHSASCGHDMVCERRANECGA